MEVGAAGCGAEAEGAGFELGGGHIVLADWAYFVFDQLVSEVSVC